ncbi:MAG: 16S rRNA pseudouridine(516) synthase RsuA [Candidatus Thiodiazotropha weberae]|uniref:Pseudouridine synthase n=1 Tax=Candidatus Thiodiazotropha endoloripes TaxID=1818881 RepID=A0A1E2UNH5_9GAMM|nr:16S rRNA pseudouridine(516) synthase RsuA [Candidatus Thiodiazotropha endoloripes]MCG7900266.1 16S rRNA pseudouridine(516) synthase RsuA [Candidatus Thiodiazotropha weberae]MCG7903692.1 16S rRNA pseudouridine(516) synthase RsuA [Candidatus Thiodiazotropha weberae]MCG7915192.1 16S rRNA pseudouridine(516) synthase RsuA [Candidatus Thiodiazotropha weberae]ODB90437.1 16S rRNA pseudouridine(516) synthase [Candidatus Thiodiazotropha endoloripes]ODB93184.1 16S rRNA pseudouridine(516) synthase [Can
MRLDRYLSQVTELSRSESRQMIRAGRVSVDGLAITQPAHQVDSTTQIHLDDRLLDRPLPRYYMVHKPVGVVCATRDPSHRTILELLDLSRPETLHIAGRLDIDATGLVLVTDDGRWSHRITSPGRSCGKTYLVALKHPLKEAQAAAIRQGIPLRNESKPTRPAELQQLDETQLRLTITEGRYHQVKRMFAAVGNRVVGLHRQSIGPLSLDESLAAGDYRALTQSEIEIF